MIFFNALSADRPFLIAGPCSAETEEQVLRTALELKPLGINLFRAGVWKPRTKPGGFEGMGAKALPWMKRVKQETGLRTTIEVATGNQVYEALKYGIDVLWIGARTTVNPFSVQEIADALQGVDIPVMIKNPVNPDLELWIGATERIQRAGVTQIAAIHRGFSSYTKTQYRNVPYWEIAIEYRRKMPEIPLICDNSHICGNREDLFDVAQMALDLNYSGLMTEVHPTPDSAWSDARQQITPETYADMLNRWIVRKSDSDDAAFNETLDMLRRRIDEIDREMFHALGRRMSISKEIGRFKRENNVSILQPQRWAEIFERGRTFGIQCGLHPEFVDKLLIALHQESINQQQAMLYADEKIPS